MSEVTTTIKNMLEKGQDPKEYTIEVCRPQCKAKHEKLQRCETALKNMSEADPELSCMYPLRDWVTCIDACVTPPSLRCSPKFTSSSSATKPDGSPDPSPMINKQRMTVMMLQSGWLIILFDVQRQ